MKRLLIISIAAFFLLLVAGWGEQAKAQENDNVSILDHFKCYKVIGKKVSANSVNTIEDEFELEENNSSRKPVLLCNPANKDNEGVNNPLEHLVCYSSKGDLKLDPAPRVRVSNQFGDDQVLEIQRKEKIFCLPSSKNCIDAEGEFILCPNESIP